MNLFNNISDSSFVKGVKSIKVTDFANGKILLKGFVVNQAKLIFLIIICTFLYMNNRMVCEKMVKKIDTLNKELSDLKYISIITETELLKAGRQEEIEKMIEERGLDLINPSTPPYKLYKK